jgi:hypothetical protein
MLPPCLFLLDGYGPADPLVAREGRYVFPCRTGLGVGRERFAEIGRKVMYGSSGDLNGCHSESRLTCAFAVDLGWIFVGPQSQESYMKFRNTILREGGFEVSEV